MQSKRDAHLLKLYTRMQKFNNQRHLYSIRTSFITCMPIMIIGAFATVINNLPINVYQTFMEKHFGELWKAFGDLAFYGTTQIVTLMICMIVGKNLADWYRRNRGWVVSGAAAGALSMTCYVIMSITFKDPTSLPFTITGVPGLFMALVTAVLSTELFIRLYIRTSVHTVWGEDPNPALPRSISSILPAIAVVALFSILRTSMLTSGFESGVTELFYKLISLPYQDMSNSFEAGLVFNLSSHVMWWFGIHGNNALDEVAKTVFVPLMEENQMLTSMGEAGGHIITKHMFDTFVYLGGAGATLGLVISKTIQDWGKSRSSLMRYALPMAVFNVNEPLVFGLPIVLNPLYIIPFILTPIANYTIAYLATFWELVPIVSYDVNWTTPIFISGYAATRSFSAVVLQLFILCVDIAVYTPFVRISDKLSQFRFDEAYNDLCSEIINDYNPQDKMIDRNDELGTAARYIANHMGNAIPKNEMYLVYQPIINAVSGKMHGVEALLRWEHPGFGMINPFVTVSLAEETQRMDSLGLWVMEQAVKQREAWTRQGLPDFYVSVNVSASQLQDPNLHKRFTNNMDNYGVPYHQIQVEVTETAALIENTATVNNLKRLHEIGCSIAMDDFGVGHSSLTYLCSQPISVVKIDSSLSREVDKSQTHRDIIGMIFKLCETLHVNTIVECVEHQEQLDCLLEEGAELIQGYYFSRPLKPEAVAFFIENDPAE